MQPLRIEFVNGPISPELLAHFAASQISNKIGAFSSFVGIVRDDFIEGKGNVYAIEYTAYESMALEILKKIGTEAMSKWKLTNVSIYHSLGIVPVGKICLYIAIASERRRPVLEALPEITERLKKEAPIWGKEYLTNNESMWKVNT